ncbi:MAG: YhjD/YihY/BrkB family envelope integrity protein [Burkholderiales bacterium]
MNAIRLFRDGANWFFQSVYVTLTLFFKTEIRNHASGLALYFFLSSIPLAYLLNTLISGNLELSEALYFLLNMLHLNFMNVDFARSSDQYYGLFKITSWVTLLVLLWSSSGLMRSVHGAFVVIFASPRRRHFIAINLMALMIIPFAFLLLEIWSLGDYLAIHYNYANISNPLLVQAMKACFPFIGMLTPFLVTWAIVFLAYFFMPPSRPRLPPAIATSFACALSVTLFQFLTNTVFQVDQYIRVYGSLGAIIFYLIWAYVISLLFLLCAEFLHVSSKIDVIAMEKLFLDSNERGPLANRIERFLFKHSERLFEKYGRSCRKGDIIVHQNAEPSEIYYLYSGKIGIYKAGPDGSVRIGEVQEGGLLGEVDYLLGVSASATFVAEAECFLFTLSPAMFEELLNSSLKLSRQVIDSFRHHFEQCRAKA